MESALAGMQCISACISFFSLCWSVVRKISIWQSMANYILCTGDKIYKDLGVTKYLNVDDLPVKIYLYGQSYDAVFFNVETREWSLGTENSLFIRELETSCRLKITRFLLFVMEL